MDFYFQISMLVKNIEKSFLTASSFYLLVLEAYLHLFYKIL